MSDLLDDDGLLDLRPRRAGARTNADLEAWAKQNAAAPAPAAPEAPAQATCHICGKRPGRRRCEACGRMACAADSWTMLSLCAACAREDRVLTSERQPRPSGNWLEEP